MKKRSVNSLLFRKTTISNFLIGGVHNDSDNSCPSAVSCESVCFCIPITQVCQIEAPRGGDNSGTPVGNSPSPASPSA